jgi:hypothetical protein
VSPGRNDPCPCGSGAKYKRCCLGRELEVERLVPELETAVEALAAEMWEHQREWCLSQFAAFYDGGVEEFGLLGPSAAERLEAHLWFLLDCPLPSGETPLWRARQDAAGRAIELLFRSELRAWRVEAVGDARAAHASCPVDGSRARLEFAREPAGRVVPGALLVARSVPLGPERWALLGSMPVVDPMAIDDFERLLSSLDAPRGELWSVHGGVLARAAWAWPEEREYTRDGELVAGSYVAFELDDEAAVSAVLDGDEELDRGAGFQPLDATRWRWRWMPPSPRGLDPGPGIRVEICAEDTDERPYVADIDVSDPGELWLSAPSRRRLRLAERLLRDRLGSLLGPVVRVGLDPPQITPRWKRERIDALLGRTAVQLRGARRAA